MKNRIIEIIEIGEPKSLIQREGEPVSELINTLEMQDEINEQIKKDCLLDAKYLKTILSDFKDHLFSKNYETWWMDREIELFVEWYSECKNDK